MKYALASIPVAALLVLFAFYPGTEPNLSAQVDERAKPPTKWEYCRVIVTEVYGSSYFGMPDTDTESKYFYYIAKDPKALGPFKSAKEACAALGWKGVHNNSIDVMNCLGDDGWELVNRADNAFSYRVEQSYMLKRPKR